MNGTGIHWGLDALIVVGGLIAFVIAFVVVSATMLSSKISRDEEDRELRASFDRMDRAA